MNQKTTYEVTITSKLDQLPIPDLRETIWARIEGELDADMPTDDGGDIPPAAPRGGKVLHFALPAFVVFIVTLFLINTKNKTPQSTNHPNQTPSTQPLTTAPAASPPPVDTTTLTSQQRAPVVDPGTNSAVSIAPTIMDSASPPITDLIPPAIDYTDQQAPPLTQGSPPQPQKTDSVAKKKRGVSGITDNDYRITPVKLDSTRKN
jgi:hypothetical protein